MHEPGPGRISDHLDQLPVVLALPRTHFVIVPPEETPCHRSRRR